MRNYILLLVLILVICPSVFCAEWAQQEWAARYNGPDNSEDGATTHTLAVDSLGNVYVTGYSYYNNTNWDYATVKYDPNGNQLWVKRYNGPGNDYDIPFAIAVDSSGNVYVTGTSYGSDTYNDYATIKYGPDGNQLWVARYNGPGNRDDGAVALAIDSSGNVYMTGYSYVSDTSSDYATVKYDTNGNQLWVARYNGPGNYYDNPSALAVDSSGNVYVTGYSYGTDGINYDYATIKYDPKGSQRWVARYNGPGNIDDAAVALAVDNSGNVYVTGYSDGNGTGYDYATVKYSPDGNQLWVARYDVNGNSWDEATGLAIDSSGNIYVTGFISNGYNADYATIKYSPDGNQLWVAIYYGPWHDNDCATALAMDNSDNVYVTGSSYNSNGHSDYTTVKYDSNGNQLWVARYNGGYGDDTGYALAVDSSDNVYVTGNSWNYDNPDLATVKYKQIYCTSPINGDLNNDCKVDLEDLAILVSHWLVCNYVIEEECL